MRQLHKSLPALLIAAFLIASPSLGHAQGCTQCRDNAASTSPETRRAYRHAILLLTVTAAGIFIAGTTLIRRHR